MGVATAEIRLDDRVTSFVTKQRKLLIGGQWVDAASGKTFPVYNPATGEVIAHAAEGDKNDIDRAVQSARKAFESGAWPKLTPSERGRLVWKLGDLILEHLEELAELESLGQWEADWCCPRSRRAAGGGSLPLHGRMGD